MNNWELVDTETGELKDAFDDLFNSTNDITVDDTDKELESPTLLLNLDEINGAAKSQAQEITERLSNYYFDERYLEEHPYIKNKIAQEIENIRILMPTLSDGTSLLTGSSVEEDGTVLLRSDRSVNFTFEEEIDAAWFDSPINVGVKGGAAPEMRAVFPQVSL